MKFERIIAGTLCAGLSDQQISAISYSIELAKQIQIQFPSIADEYRNGNSLSVLNLKHHINERFAVKPKTAQEAIRIAIGGYHASFQMFDIPAFPGLIPIDEFKQIGKNHNVENSRKIGIQYRNEGLGLFKITKEERSAIGRKSAEKQMELRIGIHAQTLEDRRLLGKKAIEAQGGTIYSDEEIQYIKLLANDSAFKNHKSQVKVSQVAEKVNEKFHERKKIRNGAKITKIIMRYKLIQPTQQ